MIAEKKSAEMVTLKFLKVKQMSPRKLGHLQCGSRKTGPFDVEGVVSTSKLVPGRESTYLNPFQLDLSTNAGSRSQQNSFNIRF